MNIDELMRYRHIDAARQGKDIGRFRITGTATEFQLVAAVRDQDMVAYVEGTWDRGTEEVKSASSIRFISTK